MILVVDNYDSFTYNLVQLLLGQGAEVEVVRNDAADAGAILAREPAGILLSPGPGRPEDAGVCMPLLARRAPIPLLGVCLGHQCMGQVLGGEVGRAARLMHGKTSSIRHDGSGIFAGIPSPFIATRYHSLDVKSPSLPAELVANAWADDDTLMGVRHLELPWFGVQFHPESILTEHGDTMVANFLAICAGRRALAGALR